MATTAKLMELKRQIGEVRDKAIQAKATMTEIDNNIASIHEEMKELGIKDIDHVDDEIEKLEAEAQDLYEKAYQKLQKWI